MSREVRSSISGRGHMKNVEHAVESFGVWQGTLTAQ
jgi:hypothetical protein